MTPAIETVLGPVAIDQLGTVMMHEHLALALSEEQTVDDMDNLQREIHDLATYGCKTIVELSNIGMGRNIERMVALARTAGANIIAGTGFYVQRWHPDWVAKRSIDDLAQLMVDELQQGMDGTNVRAGVIGEIGTSHNQITPDEEKVMRAAARAHLRTGRPISTHTSLGTLPLQQLDILESEGVDLGHVVIGHLDLAPDFQAVIQTAQRGAFVQFDTFGKEAYQPDEIRMTRLLQLVEAGFSSALLVSCDISRNSYMKAYGGCGYDHFLRVIAPELRRRGLDETSLHALLVENPRRFLKGRRHD